MGAVGFISVLFPFLLPLSIILVSKDTGEPLRESSGLARLAGTGEAGELVGRIDRGHPGRCCTCASFFFVSQAHLCATKAKIKVFLNQLEKLLVTFSYLS